MTSVVLDASVVLKWLLQEREDERDTDRAIAILNAFRSGELTFRQPVHWLAEVVAVLVRLAPTTAADAVIDLYEMNVASASGLEIDLLACELAHDLGHHVFVTLYHAVALAEPGSHLVTADARYHRKARRYGSIVLLRDFEIAS